MPNRWFICPIAGSGTSTDPYRPKYSGTPGISGWAEKQVTINGSEYYAVRYYGTNKALDEIESYSDATSIRESSYSKSDIAAYLNDKTGHSHSFAEWEERFLTR